MRDGDMFCREQYNPAYRVIESIDRVSSVAELVNLIVMYLSQSLRDDTMVTVRSALRLLVAIVVWFWVLFPAVGFVGAFVLPPDAFIQLVVLVPGAIGAVIGALIFVRRSGSLRQLRRFAMTVFAITVVVGLPVNILFQMTGEYGTPVAVITVLLLLGVVYAGGYYLVYENGYQRVKSQYS